MPKFYFHVFDDLHAIDPEGADLPYFEAAIVHATRSARSLMCETLTNEGRITLQHRIDIEDADHNVLASVSFGDAVKVEH